MGPPACHFDIRFPGNAVRVDDARHALAHQGAKDFLALSRKAGPGNVAGAKHRVLGKTWENTGDAEISLGCVISAFCWLELTSNQTCQTGKYRVGLLLGKSTNMLI